MKSSLKKGDTVVTMKAALVITAFAALATGCATAGPSNADINYLNGKVEMLSAEVRQQHYRVVVLERDNSKLSQEVAGHAVVIRVGAAVLGALIIREAAPSPSIHQPVTLGD